jgi:plastocyanin
MEPYEPSNTPFTSGPMSGYAGSKKKLLLVVALVVVLVGAGVLTAIVVGRNGSKGNNGTAVAISSTVATVDIQPGGLIPKTIKIKKGQEVTWTNKDTIPHHLTADPSILSGFDTEEPLQTGDSYTYIFDKAGTFHYYDATNPTQFVGIITVQ